MNILDYGAKFVKMREIGIITTRCLDMLEDYIEPGISTADVNNKVYEFQHAHNNVENAQYGYRFDRSLSPFPGYCCTSVNEVLCHGIPSHHVVLNDGDIVSVDITFIKDGYHGDACRTYIVGDFDPEDMAKEVSTRALVEVAQCALQIGLQQCHPGHKMGDIGKYIEEYVRHNKMYVARDFVGHGIGLHFHEGPSISHVLNEGYEANIRMEPGQTFTIEPIITLNRDKHKVAQDGWTVKGRSLAAQWEATVGITEDGYEVFAR